MGRIFKLEEQLHSKVAAEEKLERQKMVGQDEVCLIMLCSSMHMIVVISVAAGCSLLARFPLQEYEAKLNELEVALVQKQTKVYYSVFVQVSLIV